MPLAAVAALLAVLAVLAGPSPAAAHVTVLPVTPDDLWRSWNFDWYVVLPLLAAHWLYGRGVLKLWASAGYGRGISYRQAGAFLAGEAALVVALISPLDALGATLQSAHMAQHTLLIAIAPPLLLLGRPDAALAWSLPSAVTARLARLRSRLALLAQPLTATALHAAAFWIWHLPALYEAALLDPFLHWLEHLSFFGTALLLWSAILRGTRRESAAPAAMAACLLTMMQSGFLAAVLAFSPELVYGWYDGRAQLWGYTPLQDQALSGLLKWVPMTPVFLAACLACARLLLRSEPRRATLTGF